VKVRGQLTEYGLVPEEYGGDTMFVDVSAKAKLGLDELLEAIVLTADASLDLRAAVDVPAQGVAIEGHLDRGRGPVASVLVQRGTLHVGDAIVAGEAYGRVRAMLDENGKPIDFAGPARPAQVLGFQHVPGAGDNFLVVPEDRVARQIAERRQARERAAELAASRGRFRLEDILARIKEGEKSQLNLILKGDVSGSVEALEDALVKVEVDEEVSLRIIHRGVGAITENDVTLAEASDAIVIGFNVVPTGQARKMAEEAGVDIRTYRVIYQAVQEIESAARGLLGPELREVAIGQAEVRATFKVPRVGIAAGCMVTEGVIRRNSKVRLVRDGTVVYESNISTLRRFKDDVREVAAGYECGIGLENYQDLKPGDLIETFDVKEIVRTAS
ncbi:MAG: translation initiation factor IF-2, partial [Acidimicrobiia bacterium]